MFQHPLHKRVISRVVFYGSVFLFLWLLDHSKAEGFARDLPAVQEVHSH